MSYLPLICCSLALFYFCAKTYKFHRSHIKRFLSFEDLWFVYALSIIISFSTSLENTALAYLLLSLLVLGSLVLYIDAQSFRLFALEFEPKSVSYFFADIRVFNTELKNHTQKIIFNRLSLLLFLWLLFIFSLFFYQSTLPTIATLFLVQSLFVSSKVRFKFSILPAYALLVYGILQGADYLLLSHPLFSVFGLLLLAVGFGLSFVYKNADFFNHGNSFGHVVGINPIKLDKDFKPHNSDIAIISPRPKRPQKSDGFGSLKNANVLIFSIESLGRNYIDFYGGDAHLPTFDRLAKTGLVSDYHYCVSANTDNALWHWYLGQLTNPSPCLDQMPSHEKWFLTSQDSADFGLSKLLKRSGFAHVFDRGSFDTSHAQQGSNWGEADLALCHQGLDYFLARRSSDKPFFMHVLNAQTHVNYHIADPKKYNKFPNQTNYGRYLNALEETDELITQTIKRLEKNRLMDNTIVIICGDHGQSFGKNGYKVHSNAIIAEQILTPFVLSHPSLSAHTVKVSSHFDILPTIFNLLGIEAICNPFGRCLFSHQAFAPIPLYTKTNRGDFPSSFGYVTADEKIIIDAIYKKVSCVNHDDETTRALSAKEKSYQINLAARALANT